MKVERLTGVLGAELTDVNVTQLTDTQFQELRELACEYGVVFLPHQVMTVQQQVEFSHRFGPAAESPFIEPSPDHPEVIKVLKEASDGKAFNFGGAWHSDFSFLATPPSFTILYALDIPPYGGDTLWSCMAAAYEALSEQQKEQFATLHACDDSANEAQVHPLITTHPETGKKILFYNRAYVRDLVGVSDDEKLRLMEWLHLHTTDAKFSVRHKWSVGDLAVWDNRSTQHYALNDYAGFRRELHRTTVAGSRPLP